MPYARMYFPMGEKVSLFGQFKIDIEPGKTKEAITQNNSTNTTSGNNFYFDAGINPGISLSLSDKIAIDARFGFIGFTSNKAADKNDLNNSSTTNNNFIFSIDPSTFSFGIRFFIM
jgi:hypothetical protein